MNSPWIIFIIENIDGSDNMVGIYFSGTGNTRYCCEQFLSHYQDNVEMYSIEDDMATEIIKRENSLVFAYPIYFSNMPKIVSDFINNNKEIFVNKKIYIIATMALFSGDGAGCSARLFKKYGAKIIGGLHLKMPDCIGDEKALKKSVKENKEIIEKSIQKIIRTVEKLKNGKTEKKGLYFFSHVAGFFGQRLWFYHKTNIYCNKLKIDKKKCVGCGLCEKICPMQNISINMEKAEGNDTCTMCYRCISNCPQKAITLLGNKVYEQYKIKNYITQ